MLPTRVANRGWAASFYPHQGELTLPFHAGAWSPPLSTEVITASGHSVQTIGRLKFVSLEYLPNGYE